MGIRPLNNLNQAFFGKAACKFSNVAFNGKSSRKNIMIKGSTDVKNIVRSRSKTGVYIRTISSWAERGFKFKNMTSRKKNDNDGQRDY
jgi:hypothetical protein